MFQIIMHPLYYIKFHCRNQKDKKKTKKWNLRQSEEPTKNFIGIGVDVEHHTRIEVNKDASTVLAPSF